ncbi:MAG TPA: dihydroxyacetone kinase subunit DhaK [Bryobacteraceae bacterium]|nr:dihydroxyacetone kinase subunit DhaK [Bryobacteraceae bacterium]HXJ40949.1 dihydroxyacetone kinase subunit DhaK [Bryobacteraceae bacterium]
MKKLINDPRKVAGEALEGLALAYSQYLRLVAGVQAVVRKDAPVTGKVGVLSGGGSGHEPMFAGFVGAGMADGSVAGNIFASPPPQPIVAAARAVQGGAGVLFLYGNYSGDVLNFDMAAEMLEEEGIHISTVRITDDVASAPPERYQERRGIAGDFFVIKVAGACAEQRATLAEVTAAAEEANRNTRSMGVALSSCIIPASGKPIFDLAEGDMEVGMGLHGEPGVERARLKSANQVAEELVTRILEDMPELANSDAAILVNGLGATPLAELFIVFRAAHALLIRHGIAIRHSYVGNYATSLEMAGCSISLLRLNERLKHWIAAPVQTPALIQI